MIHRQPVSKYNKAMFYLGRCLGVICLFISFVLYMNSANQATFFLVLAIGLIKE